MIEAMKMKNSIKATRSGKIAAVVFQLATMYLMELPWWNLRTKDTPWIYPAYTIGLPPLTPFKLQRFNDRCKLCPDISPLRRNLSRSFSSPLGLAASS